MVDIQGREQLIAAEDSAGFGAQRIEQPKFDRREVERAAVEARFMTTLVDGQPRFR